MQSADVVGYDCIKTDLWILQSYKCAYCERIDPAQGNDVDHFRPKVRYWWLAWDWSNLLFVCQNCNRWSKNDRFPLLGGQPLTPEDVPPGTEVPGLVDPYSEDPMNHIAFRPVRADGDGWAPFPANGSTLGRETIVTLRLDGQQYQTLYDHHIRNHVLPRVREVDQALAAGDAADIAREWSRATEIVNRHLPNAALSHDALDYYFPLAVREANGLLLPRPS